MSSDCGKTRLDWMDTLAQVLFHRPSADHTWHIREQNKYNIHPAVREAVLLASPADWHRLVLEWPHVSTSDPARLAYTRSIEHGEANRQTVTSTSKYLALNFPSLQSHTIRDICAKFGSHAFRISWNTDEMLELLHASPNSCMRWDHWSAGQWHPYQCYAPEFGWGLAVRLENDIPMARAIVNKNSMSFVRSFGDRRAHPWLYIRGWSCPWHHRSRGCAGAWRLRVRGGSWDGRAWPKLAPDCEGSTFRINAS